MSVRRGVDANAEAERMRAGIESMRFAAAMAQQEPVGPFGSPEDAARAFDSLSEIEKSAATIGQAPDEWKPIGFMNSAHYTTLLKNNALSGRLTQQIEAFKVVASR